MELCENQTVLQGTLAEPPCFSHENHGRSFFRFLLNIPRLSGTVDRIPVIAQQCLFQCMNLLPGMPLRVEGQLRSYNQRSDGCRHLLVFVFARTLCVCEEEPDNKVLLQGIICREPNLRRTPLGRDICDLMLAVPRAFHRSDYIPCILWGSVARKGACFQVRDRITITGRIQSRSYTKLTDFGIEERTAYEVSALTAELTEDSLSFADDCDTM